MTSTTAIRTRFSRRALRTLAAFGLTVDDLAPAGDDHGRRGDEALIARARIVAAAIDRNTEPGQVAVITGASGSGKSSVLRALTSRLRDERRCVVLAEPAHRLTRLRGRVIDTVGAARRCAEPGSCERAGALDEALGLLAAAGLADARLMVAPVSHLSDGELARLALARAMDRLAHAHPPDRGPRTLMVDELAASLDIDTARSLALTLARWVRNGPPGVRAVVVTHRAEVVRALRPDHRTHLPPMWLPVP